MAGYNYMSGGYKSHEKNDGRGTKHSGYETHSPGWGKPGFASHGEGHRDHVCKPVIIDAQGRKRPIVSYGPIPTDHTNGIVTKTETIIEQVHVPQVRYGNNSPTKVGHVKEYGWSRSLSPSHDRSGKTSAVSSPYWRQTSENGYSGSNGYGSNYDHGSNYNHGSNGWNKPSGNNVRDPYFSGYQGTHQREREGLQEPTIINSGGWVRPSPLGWAIPPNNDIPLSKPTNNIGAAIDYLKDTTKHTPANIAPAKPWLAVPTPMVPTIDSREARRRYGTLSESPREIKTADSYSSSIDSREAVRRYGGQAM